MCVLVWMLVCWQIAPCLFSPCTFFPPLSSGYGADAVWKEGNLCRGEVYCNPGKGWKGRQAGNAPLFTAVLLGAYALVCAALHYWNIEEREVLQAVGEVTDSFSMCVHLLACQAQAFRPRGSMSTGSAFIFGSFGGTFKAESLLSEYQFTILFLSPNHPWLQQTQCAVQVIKQLYNFIRKWIKIIFSSW